MVILEFFGLPGVGKSTLLNQVAEQLQKRGCSVCIQSNLNIKIYNIFTKIGRHIRPYFLPKQFMVNMILFRHGIKANISIKTIHALILLHYNIEKADRENRYDYLLLDEGYISNMNSSKKILYCKSLNNLMDDLLTIHSGFQYIYCTCSLSENYRRIRSRNCMSNRYDRMNDTKLYISLNRKSQYFNTIRGLLENYNWIMDIDMENDSSVNMQLILANMNIPETNL